MKLLNDWVRTRIWENKPSGIALPQGYERNLADEDVLFEVIEAGSEVLDVHIGDLIVFSPLAGAIKFKLPDDAFMSIAVRRPEIIGIINAQPRS